MQYSKLGSINYPKYSKNNNLSTQYILVILHPKAMAQAKPRGIGFGFWLGLEIQ
jgi:hypothetical protein